MVALLVVMRELNLVEFIQPDSRASSRRREPKQQVRICRQSRTKTGDRRLFIKELLPREKMTQRIERRYYLCVVVNVYLWKGVCDGREECDVEKFKIFANLKNL